MSLILGFLFLSLPSSIYAIDSCSDDFSSSNSCSWEQISDKISSFTIKNQQLLGQSIYFINEKAVFYLTGNETSSNYGIEADVKSVLGVDKTLVFRYQNPQKYYVINLRSSFNQEGNDLILVKHCCMGKSYLLSKVSFVNEADTWYKLKVEITGKRIQALVNNQKILDYYDISDTNNEISYGKAGLMVWGGHWENSNNTLVTQTVFDNFKFYIIPEKEIYVLIPGLGASWNLPSLLSCKSDINQSGWTLAPYAVVYDRLIATFNTNQFLNNDKFFVYAYDWRLPMDKQADLLQKYLENIAGNYVLKINFISHSLGGLVLRSFLARYGLYFNINKTITLGTPHFGTPLAYPMWEGGVVDYQDKSLKLAIDLIMIHCRELLQIDKENKLLQTIVPSIQDILPIFPYLQNEKGEVIKISDMIEKNNWLLNLNDTDSLKKLVTVSGNDHQTADTITINQSETPSDTNWPDGQVVSINTSKEGDGTILEKSALSPLAASQITLPQTDHGELVYSEQGLNTIFSNLGLEYFNLPPPQSDTSIKIPSLPSNLNLLNTSQIVWKKYTLKMKK